MPDSIRILIALSIAVLAAAGLSLLVGRLGRAGSSVRRRIGGLLGVGAGIYAGCWWLGFSPNWPPREDQDRLLLLLLPAVIAVEAVISVVGRPRWLPWVLRLALAASAGPLLLYGSSYVSDLSGPGTREWSTGQMGLVFGLLAVVLAAVWCALWLLVRRSACRFVPIVLALVCAGASVTVMLSGYASAGQIGFTIAAGLVGAVVGSLLLGGRPEMNGVMGVGLVGLFALVVVGRFFGQLTTPNTVLLLSAPILAWGAELPLVRRGGPKAHGLARVLLPSIPVAVALLLAQRQFLIDAGRTTSGSDEAAVDDYASFGK